MGVFANDEKQLSYIYSSESDLGRKVLGYVEGIDKGIRVIDVSKEDLGDTVWTEIIDLLDTSFAELLSTDHPKAPEVAVNGDFDTNGWLKILDKNPVLLQDPIAINGDHAKIVESRADILSFYEVDSAGLEQSPSSGAPDISSKTEGETFVPDRD
jgi:arsenate reductase-like glutaredoxin family protein